ncbi:LacI family DNA-binding transcriptional regulator [Chitinibacter bivalviorum]|uniref:LacI family DNA-binding transcriptional regulator n=1 Tax=Chitinibacter bivalviorum TaxID=2739434 RepID=A0A7H9BKH4_9NEIS|nr:LacI family DNA-binding transcriptional regulator [Chitinibacter bivalviorum]QLG88989.1 LacI family DNA-binding transcriptional regulator [Chitinibacter bivalviorum]
MTAFERLTIADIAKLAGVSKTTASMILNGRAEQYRIAAATVARVQQVAADNHFQPSASARLLRSRRSGTLGLVIPELTNFAHAMLAQTLEPLCRDAGFQLFVVSSNDDAEMEIKAVEQLLARQVDGLMLVPCTNHAKLYAKWAKRMPLVLLDRRVIGSNLPFVVSNAEEQVFELIAKALAQGVREIAYFGGLMDLSPSVDRLAGYQKAWQAAGLVPNPQLITHRDYHQHSGYTMMAECYSQLGRYPEAIFCASISLLEGALEFMNELDHFKTAPEYLMSFDDHRLLDCMPRPINAVVQDSAGLAEQSLARVQALLAGEPVQSSWVPAHIHWRQPFSA